jgi:NADH:ubiquinone oxidoreductase subunit K
MGIQKQRTFFWKRRDMPSTELNVYLFIAGVLMGVELVLNGANLNFVAFARYTTLGLDGQVMSLFVIVLAAAEAAIALAIALNFYNNHLTIDVDRGDDLHG